MPSTSANARKDLNEIREYGKKKKAKGKGPKGKPPMKGENPFAKKEKE